MSWVRDNFFGGAEKEAGQEQINANNRAAEIIRQQTEQASGDASRLFGQQEQNTRSGIQAGLDLYGQTIPAQFEQSRSGNLAAQQMLSGALPQMNQAILGGAIDYSQFQPQALPQVDTSMFNVQMPDYTFMDGKSTTDPIEAPQTPQSPLSGNQNPFAYPQPVQ